MKQPTVAQSTSGSHARVCVCVHEGLALRQDATPGWQLTRISDVFSALAQSQKYTRSVPSFPHNTPPLPAHTHTGTSATIQQDASVYTLLGMVNVGLPGQAAPLVFCQGAHICMATTWV